MCVDVGHRGEKQITVEFGDDDGSHGMVEGESAKKGDRPIFAFNR